MDNAFLATPHLYRHRFDIDDVIARLCAATPSTLNTGAGEYVVEPLPLSYLQEALAHPALPHLPAATQQAVQHLVATTTSLAELSHQFGQSPAGDWLRERLKDAALEWLDANDLIPPSMRHGPAIPRRRVQAGKVEIV